MRFGSGKRIAALLGLGAASFVVGMIVCASVAAGISALEGPGVSLVKYEFTWQETIRNIFDVLSDPRRPEHFSLVVAVLALTVAPVLLVAPIVGPLATTAGTRSLRPSIIGAAILGGLCAGGILLVISDLVALGLGSLTAQPSASGGGYTEVLLQPMILFPAWIVLGGIWAWLLARAGAARDPNRIVRFVRWIFAGTCVEIAIAAPTYVVAIRRDSCACSWGSWWAIVVGTTTLILLCGPMLVLLATRKARMQWLRTVCPECGYPRRGGAKICPECGEVLA